MLGGQSSVIVILGWNPGCPAQTDTGSDKAGFRVEKYAVVIRDIAYR